MDIGETTTFHFPLKGILYDDVFTKHISGLNYFLQTHKIPINLAFVPCINPIDYEIDWKIKNIYPFDWESVILIPPGTTNEISLMGRTPREVFVALLITKNHDNIAGLTPTCYYEMTFEVAGKNEAWGYNIKIECKKALED